MIRVRLSIRCGAMAAMCWAIIPPMLAPNTVSYTHLTLPTNREV